MLTKTQRDEIIADLQALDFSYGNLDKPEVRITRDLERFDTTEYQVVVDFYPVSGNMFKSVSDAIGWSKKNQYVQFGYCQPELVSITSNCTEFVSKYNINGRNYAYFLVETILTHIMKTWDTFLRQFGARRASNRDVRIEDDTVYNRRLGEKIYRYTFDVYVKTQFNWTHELDDYEEGTGVIKRMYYNFQDEDQFKIINSE